MHWVYTTVYTYIGRVDDDAGDVDTSGPSAPSRHQVRRESTVRRRFDGGRTANECQKHPKDTERTNEGGIRQFSEQDEGCYCSSLNQDNSTDSSTQQL